MKLRTSFTAAVFGLLTLAAPAAKLIPATGMSASANRNYSLREPGKVLNGLTNGGGFSDDGTISVGGAGNPNNPAHYRMDASAGGNTNFGQNVTWSGSDVANQWIRVDLGADYVLDSMAFFNLCVSTGGNHNRGVNQADIYYRTDAQGPGTNTNSDLSPLDLTGWTALGTPGTQTFTQNTVAGDQPGGDAIQPDVIPFGGVVARYVAFDVNTTHGGSAVGISELLFFEEATNPALTVAANPDNIVVAVPATTGTSSFTIWNDGASASLNIDSASFAGGTGFSIDSPSVPFSVAAGASQVVTIEWDSATAAGTFEAGTLTIEDTGNGLSADVPIKAGLAIGDSVVLDYNDHVLGDMAQAGNADTGIGFTESLWNPGNATDVVIAGDLDVTTVTGYSAPATGSPQSQTTNSTSGDAQERQIVTLGAGINPVWFSFVASAPSSGGRVGFGLNSSGTGSANPRLLWLSNQIRFLGGGQDVNTVFAATADPTVFVGRITINENAAGHDRIEVWPGVTDMSSVGALGAPALNISGSNIFGNGLTRLNPTTYGAIGANAPIIDNIRLSDLEESAALDVIRTGVPPVIDPELEIVTSPSAISVFAPDISGTTSFVIRNDGPSINLDVSSITIPAGFSVTSPAPPFSVTPGSTQTIVVEFDSSAVAPATAAAGTLVFISNDTSYPVASTTVEGGVATLSKLLPNWDFEAPGSDAAGDTDTFAMWGESGTATSTRDAPGLLAGSTTSAHLRTAGGTTELRGDFGTTVNDFVIEFPFAFLDAAARDVSFLVRQGTAQVNVRYEGNEWSVFNNVSGSGWESIIDMTGAPLSASVDGDGNGSLDDGGDVKNVYIARFTGKEWGHPTPTFELEILNSGGSVLATSGAGLAKFQNFAPNAIGAREVAFSTLFGGVAGMWIDDVCVSGAIVSDYESFVANAGLSGGDALPGADPDDDGLNNDEEFSQGTNPNDSDDAPLTVDVGGGTFTPGSPIVHFDTGIGDFVVRFMRRVNFADVGLAYDPQFNHGLDPGDWESSAVGPTVLVQDGAYEVVEIPYTVFLSTGRKGRFSRVAFTYTP